MNPLSIFLIGVGLSMDAFAVSLTGCMSWHGHRLKTALKLAFCFGLFQAIMPIIGWASGTYLVNFFSTIDHWIAFGLLVLVGGKMILEALKRERGECQKENLKLRTLLLLAIATSLDALAIGLSFALLKVSIITPVLMIGATTFCISFAGVLIGEKLGTLIGKKIEVVGGFILIAIGIKILASHLFV